MTLDPSHQPLTQQQPTCHYCGAKFDLGYHYTCHTCGATYCYIHMSKHLRAHRTPSSQPVVPGVATAQAPVSQLLTSDPEEIELIRSYMMGLLGQDGSPDLVS